MNTNFLRGNNIYLMITCINHTLQNMEVKPIFGGVFLSVHDPVKHRGLMLSRDAVKDMLESEDYLSGRLLKMVQKKSTDEEIMKELPDSVVLRIGIFKEQLRVDIQETTIKEGSITFLKSGVNLSVLSFLEVLRMLRAEYEKTAEAVKLMEQADDDDEAAPDSPPPTKKAKLQQSPSKTHHAKDGKGARSFRKGVKALKKKSTVMSSDEDSN